MYCRKILSTRILYPAKLSFKSQNEIKMFSESKWREFIIHKTLLEKIADGYMSNEGNLV